MADLPTSPGDASRTPLIIGVAGGVGAGKSAAAACLAKLGCVVIDSDARAKAKLDDRSVRVMIPGPELSDPAGFIADILSIRFDPSLLDLPARVVVNEREGIIVMTGNVEISPTALTHGDLIITSVTPPPQPQDGIPVVEEQRWAAVSTSRRSSEAAQLQDLLAAFKQLDVSVDDQIAILMQLHRTGSMHAELIVN